MSWGPDGFGLPLPLNPVDEPTYVQFIEDHADEVTFDTRPLVDAQDQPAGELIASIRTDGQEIAKRIRHFSPQREDEFWVADPTA